MTVIQIGLTDKTGNIDKELMQETAAALGIQVSRDAAPIWNVSATVQWLPNASRIPAGVWPIFLVASLPPGEGGFHQDNKNQPYAEVIATPDNDDWTIDASHEFIEMLVDPTGNRLQTSRAIKISGNGVEDTTSEFEYLVEACDPCEDNSFAYSINGIAVSDFITPHFYDPVVKSGVDYSFGGNIKGPRQLLKNGYISFINPEANEVEQILNFGKPKLRKLGPATGSSLRVFVDSHTMPEVVEHRGHNDKLNEWCKDHREHRTAAAFARGEYFNRMSAKA
jgi:hypothetical protein